MLTGAASTNKGAATSSTELREVYFVKLKSSTRMKITTVTVIIM